MQWTRAFSVFRLTLLGGFTLLLADAFPGMSSIIFGASLFTGLIFYLLFLAWPLLVIGLALADVLVNSDPPPRKRWWSVVVVIVVGCLVVYRVPARLVFSLYVSTFHELAARAPVDVVGGENIEVDIGPYHVTSYSADSRGGVYFCTNTIPPDFHSGQKYYGIVFRPNPEGAPYGDIGYRYNHLFGDWYTFKSEDDW